MKGGVRRLSQKVQCGISKFNTASDNRTKMGQFICSFKQPAFGVKMVN